MPAHRKQPGTRRRRNLGQDDWTRIPADACVPEEDRPELPGEINDWLDSTREWWDGLWGSPIATMYQPSDHRPLIRLARLYDLEERDELPASAYGEITKLEDRYGLNPKALKALGWVVEEPKEEGAEVRSISDAQRKPKRAPRGGPRAVDPAAK
jgi:hypothetical protein